MRALGPRRAWNARVATVTTSRREGSSAWLNITTCGIKRATKRRSGKRRSGGTTTTSGGTTTTSGGTTTTTSGGTAVPEPGMLGLFGLGLLGLGLARRRRR